MTEEDHQHQSPIKTPKQLVIVVVLAFMVPIVVIGLLSQLVTSGMTGARDDDAARRLRIAPVGTVEVADPNAPHVALSGEQVFGQVCKTCHEAGLAGAPKMGDNAAWAPRIAQGAATLFKHAIEGFTGKNGMMPAKGGNTDLADDDVERAVVYMANRSGGKLAEPKPAANAVAAAPTAAPVAAAAPVAVAAAAATPVAATAPAASAGPADGKATYESTCHVCHGTGLAGAPKFGDKAAWAPRIAEGLPTLHQHALQGYQGKTGVMPAKGGNTALSDAAVQAAVDYMASAAK
ncbi:MAG TPA: c-type cytochrome [Casimicrobiaceae bacterium]|jgi:cytochrome c5